MADLRDDPNGTAMPTQRLSDGDWAGRVLLADTGRYSSQGGMQTGRSAITDAYNRTSASGFTPRPEQPIPDPKQMSGAPKSGKNADQKPPTTKAVGSTGTSIYGGIVAQTQEYNEDFYWRAAIDVYEQMRRTDAQVAAILTMLYLPIERADWDITPASDDPADVEIASFVKSALFDDLVYVTTEGRTVRQAWQSIVQQVLTMLPFGFSVFAKWWRIDDEGFVKLARLEPILQRTLWRWWPGADNQLVGVQQRGFKNWQIVYEDIHADALLLFVNRQEGSNYDGWSVLRAAYKHWYYLDVFYRLQGIGIEKHTFMPPIGMLGPLANSTEDANALFEQIKNIRTADSNGLVVPHGSSVEFPKGLQRGAGQEIEFAIHHHDDKIARAVLASFVSMGSNETGTFALADVLVRTFYDTLQGTLEYICGVFNAELIPQLVNYNFRGVKIYPKLTGGSVRHIDMADITALLPYLNGDPQLEDWLRKLVGAPMAPASAVNTTNPSGGQPDANGKRPRGNDLSGGGKGGVDKRGNARGAVNGQSGGDDTATDEGADGGDGADGGGALSEVALLSDALESLGLIDAVERAEAHGAHGRQMLSNPYPRGPHGHYGEGGEHGMHQSQVGSKLKGAAGKHNPEHATGEHAGEKVGGAKKGAAGAKASKAGGAKASKTSPKAKAGDEAGAKTATGKAAAHPAAKSALPKSYSELAGMTKIAGPHGSQEGQWYRLEKTGHEFYVKPAHSDAHAYNEVGAMRAYEAMGLKAGRDIPHVGVLHGPDGKAYIVSQKLEGVTQHSPEWWSSHEGQVARVAAQKQFGADALLAHWDVVGLGHDNLLVGPHGEPVRIEAGGAMAYRAQGGVKASWQEGAPLAEAYTMRGISHGAIPGNTQAANVFGGIGDKRAGQLIGASAKRLDGAIASGKLAAAWQKVGMPEAQIHANIKVLSSRIEQVPGLQKDLGYKAPAAKSGAKTAGGGVKAKESQPHAGLVVYSGKHGEVAITHFNDTGYAISHTGKGPLARIQQKTGLTLKQVQGELKAIGYSNTINAAALNGEKAAGGAKGTGIKGAKGEKPELTPYHLNAGTGYGLAYAVKPGGDGINSLRVYVQPEGHNSFSHTFDAATHAGTWKIVEAKTTYAKKANAYGVHPGHNTWTVKATGLTPEQVTTHLQTKYKIANDFAKDRMVSEHEAAAKASAKALDDFAKSSAKPSHAQQIIGQGYASYTKAATSAEPTRSVAVTHNFDGTYTLKGSVGHGTPVIHEAKDAAEVTHLLRTQYKVSNPFTGTKAHDIKEAMPGEKHAAHIVLQANHHDIHLEGHANGHVAIRVAHNKDAHGTTIGGQTKAVKLQHAAMPREKAVETLTKMGLDEHGAKLFTHLASTYGKAFQGGPKTVAEKKVAAAVNARRTELDAKFGPHSTAAARAHVATIMDQYKGVRAAIDHHLAGGSGSHLTAKTIANAMYGGHSVVSAEKLAKGREALQKLHEVTEWDLLHSSRVSHQGTIALFHGTNGDLSREQWRTIFEHGKDRRGTPFTDRATVARNFTSHGTHGPFAIAAHMPVSNVIIHHGIRNDQQFANEHEYTVGGHAKTTHYTFYHPEKLQQLETPRGKADVSGYKAPKPKAPKATAQKSQSTPSESPSEPAATS